MKPLFRHLRTLAALCTLMLASSALACEAWLARLTLPVELSTLTQRITTTTTVEGQAVRSEILQVIDFENRRIYSQSDIAGVGEIILRYVDGQATMQLAGMPGVVPAMPAMAAELEQLFDAAFAQSGLPQDYELVSCDGPHNYAGLVSGEQVTVKTLVPDASGRLVRQEARLLFADAELVAQLMMLPGLGEVLIVFETLDRDDAGMIIRAHTRSYQLAGDAAELFADTTVEVLAYNEPIDESLFAP